MLRVEASNLPHPRGAPRSRHLLPEPPTTPRHARPTRDEILPPIDDTAPPVELVLPERDGHSTASKRWSVRLELIDAEIARLYGQGLTHGAVVWKEGMQEWRPLLITPELFDLLRRTRTTLSDSEPSPNVNATAADVRLPRPARLPSDVANFDPGAKPTSSTVAPTASTIAPTAGADEPSTRPRQPIELVAVAVAAFALAWLGHAKLYPSHLVAASPALATLETAVVQACDPKKTAEIAASATSSSSIPTVSVADLPLLGASCAAASPARGGGSHGAARATRTSNGAPSRADLVAALSQVARSAGSCGDRGGPVRVVMSFANSGVARSIQVSGADLPAGARSCIISAASRARVPAFPGDPVTVSKTL